MRDRTIKALLILNLLVLTAVLIRPHAIMPLTAAQNSSTPATRENPRGWRAVRFGVYRRAGTRLSSMSILWK